MRKIYFFLLLLLCSFITNAQSFIPPSFADLDNNYRNYVNQVFGALEVNRVPTGLLTDYGFDFTDPKIYNGSVLVDSTLMEQGIYSDLYKTIYTSRFNNNVGSLRHPSIQDSLCYTARQKEVITLSGLLFKYNAIDPNAQASSKMQTVNGQLKDQYVNGVWQNPYQEFTTVAISPSVIHYKLSYCSVVIPSALFLSNMLTQISNLQFDAGDGEGYRTLTFDEPLSLNYADTGWKHWVFKITLTNNQQLFSHSKVHFNNTSNRAGSGGNALARGTIDLTPPPITAVEQFNGGFGVADIVISYRNANDPVLRRPLIVAEGLDPGWIIIPEEPEGLSDFDGFIRTVSTSGSGQLVNLIGDIFNPNAPSAYDIVYINWRNGTDWLQRNALVLEQVIRWVNQNKQNDFNTGLRNPNVVLGSSMGGVLARMALGRMDRGEGLFNGNGGFAAHETSLYVSLDAPHQGANVPLGYQALARHGARMYISTGPTAMVTEAVQFIRNGPSPLLALLLADQPAARQLLTNRIDLFYNPANAANQQFLQELRTNWAYPVNIRNIAISNGNECAIGQEFTPGSSLLFHFRSTKTRFVGDLIVMAAGLGLSGLGISPLVTTPLLIPGSSKFELTLDIRALANGGGNQVYHGNIKLTKKILWLAPVSINVANKTYNAPTGLLPLDTYPGGFYTVLLANQPGTVSQDWMFTYNNSFFIQRRFNFIPTTSALDIGQGNTAITNTEFTARYIGATPPAAPFNTPFQNFTTAYNIDNRSWPSINGNLQNLNNEPHESFYLRNANWLAVEMAIVNPQPQLTNCNAFCQNSIITGNNNVCSSEVYTAPFGNGVIYNWSVNNSSLTLSPIGNSVLVTNNGTFAGEAILTVTISGNCGNTTLNRTINIGTPKPGPITWTWNVPPNRVVLDVDDVPGATSYQWYLDGVLKATTSNSYYHLPMSGNVSCDNFYYFSVRAVGSCGTSPESYVAAAMPPCGFAYTVSPNPSSDNIRITSNEEVTAKSGGKKAEIHEVEIYDKMGVILKKQKFAKGQTTANISINTLPNDVYTLRIFDGKTWHSSKVIVQH